LTAAISKSNTLVIFTNQLREKIGIMFGNPETTPGGRALKFYSSVRLDVRRVDSIKDGERVVGNRTRVKVVKNKVAAPFRIAEFDIMYNEGISKAGSIIDVAIEAGVVQKTGAWFSYGDEKISQGREAAKEYLKEHPKIALDIEKKAKDILTSGKPIMEVGIENGEEEDAEEEIGREA
jgi:recombination protein RecA